MGKKAIRVFIIAMVALIPVIAIPVGVTTTNGVAAADPPPHCLPWPVCTQHVCPDPSQICPPSDNVVGGYFSYSWQGSTTGTEQDQEFTGTSLPSGWVAQGNDDQVGSCAGDNDDDGESPGVDADSDGDEAGTCIDLWENAKVGVSGGALDMTTTCANTGFGPGGTYAGCESGGVEQTGTSDEPLATAVEAKVTGATTNSSSYWTDNVFQYGAYPTWPPEIDFMENGTGNTTAYNEFLHCGVQGDPDNDGEVAGSGTDPDSDGDAQSKSAQFANTNISLNVGNWNTYEVDWTTTSIKVYANGTLETTWSKTTHQACNNYWPPSPASALNLYLQSQIIGTANPSSGTYGVEVDWVAQQPLS